MIDKAFLQRIGLNGDQVTILTDALEKESKFRQILGSEHVSHIESIMKMTDMNEIDLSNEALLREKIRAEYDDMIPKFFKKY